MQIKKAMKFALMKVHISSSAFEPLNSYHLQLCQHIFFVQVFKIVLAIDPSYKPNTTP